MRVKVNQFIQLEIAGQNSVILYFSSVNNSSAITSRLIEPDINNHVQQAVKLIRQHTGKELIDLIPSYASILVVFNLLEIEHEQLINKLVKILQNFSSTTNKTGKLVELPAYYSVEVGVDLWRIAKYTNLCVEEVISIHQAVEYQVYAVGFAPGFAYLGEVDSRIAMARHPTPRLNVPKGAIAIADQQTAVYPSQSPGGWNLIGLCPIDMFNAEITPSMPVEVGDRVKFVAINKQAFLSQGGVIPGVMEAIS